MWAGVNGGVGQGAGWVLGVEGEVGQGGGGGRGRVPTAALDSSAQPQKSSCGAWSATAGNPPRRS